ncbi:MAG: hypothetical protein WAU86_15070, partial [Oricola sp.]
MAAGAPLSEDAISAAHEWFKRQDISEKSFSSIPLEESAKRLTKAVYSFCISGNAPQDLNDLFVACTAACGGYSYVLRGLLETIGAETRYANFYNIPNQGNHTGVEVRIGDRWGFLDPTFGAYFTVDGSPDGETLSVRQVAYEVPFGTLDKHVLQARKQPEEFVLAKLGDLFNEQFEHSYMTLINYQVAERISRANSDSLLSLDIPLEVENGKAEFGSMEIAGLVVKQSEWLALTNATLNDDN